MTHYRNIPARKIAAALPIVLEWERRNIRQGVERERIAMIAQFVAGMLAGGRKGSPEVLVAEATKIADAVLSLGNRT